MPVRCDELVSLTIHVYANAFQLYNVVFSNIISLFGCLFDIPENGVDIGAFKKILSYL